jgi:predicted nucleotidyltransferase
MKVTYLGNRERQKELAAELAHAVTTLQTIAGVEKVILFGSMTGGRIGIKSDLDLIVIQKTDQAFLSRAIDLMKHLNPNLATDILVYTPEEFAAMQKSPNRFVQNILENGRVVYENKLIQ